MTDSALPSPAPPSVWAQGPCVVVCLGADLPARCLRCNSDAKVAMIVKRFWWVPPEVETHYFVLRQIPFVRALGIILKWIDELRTHRSIVLRLPLCARHRLARKLAFWCGWTLIAAGIALIYHTFGFEREPDALKMLGGTAAIIVGAISASWNSKFVVPVIVDETRVTLQGPCEQYLAMLPRRGPSEMQARPVEQIVAATAELRARMRGPE